MGLWRKKEFQTNGLLLPTITLRLLITADLLLNVVTLAGRNKKSKIKIALYNLLPIAFWYCF